MRFVFSFVILLFTAHAFAADAPPNAADLYKKAFTKAGELRETILHALSEEGDDGIRKLSEAQINLVGTTHIIADLLDQAKTIDHCDWDDPFFKNPIQFDISPWLSKARLVTHITILRARHLLHQGKAKEAIDELMAAFRMGRQIGRNCTVISKMVQTVTDLQIINAMAQLAPLMPADLRRGLPDRLDAAIKADTMRQTMAGECKAVVVFFRTQFLLDPAKHGEAWETAQRESHKYLRDAWIDEKNKEKEFDPQPYRDITKLAKDEPKKYLAIIEEYEKACADLLATYDAPSEQVKAKFDEWKKGVNASNLLISELANDTMGLIGRLPLVDRRSAAHQMMFRAAIAYLDDGDAALDKHRAPMTNEKFELVKEKTGFELRYGLKGDAIPLTVRIMIAR